MWQIQEKKGKMGEEGKQPQEKEMKRHEMDLDFPTAVSPGQGCNSVPWCRGRPDHEDKRQGQLKVKREEHEQKGKVKRKCAQKTYARRNPHSPAQGDRKGKT
jgi:hypothetical protein